MRVYHFLNSEFGLQDIKRRRLKVATINDLNDPFELLGPSSKDQAVRQAFLRVKDGLNKDRGILCFSRNWSNPVQWSHYADRHKGLCLGFDVSNDALAHVIYQAARFEPNLAALAGRDEVAQREMQKILTTKYSHWRYEREVRVFIKLEDKDPETGLYFVDFGNDLALKEVIVGHNSAVTRSKLDEALGNLQGHIQTCKARLAFRSFKVVRQRNSTFWH